VVVLRGVQKRIGESESNMLAVGEKVFLVFGDEQLGELELRWGYVGVHEPG
jgi:hypothetical protein